MSASDVRRVLEWVATARLGLPDVQHGKDVPPSLVMAAKSALDELADAADQQTPVCAECGDSIVFKPKSGFGNLGEWQHRVPRRGPIQSHEPRPKVFVS